MAEAIVFSLASKVLSAMASPAFKMAYEKGVSIREARNELSKLNVTIETIHAVLLDAEKKQEGSATVRKWIQRLKAVLYDTEDFFDEVLTEDLLKQQMSLKSQVRASCSKLNLIVSRNSISKKVKVIRERLAEISSDMAQLGFVQGHTNDPSISMGAEKYNARCFIGDEFVIGRDEDKNIILDMLISESSDTAISNGPAVIAIDGIGGMGKTTLANLIYNDEKVKKNFEANRWIACISDTTDEKEVLAKIYQSICGGGYSDLTVFQLQAKIKESIKGKKYLLVLDDVWEDHRGRWEHRKSMLSSGVKGSKIVVTTRLESVVKAMGAVGTHNLKGLSEEASWYLFKSLAFDSSYDENDRRRQDIGRKLLNRCRAVPLAIWCMGSLLHNKTIQEWEEIERVGLPTVGGEYNDEIMSVLKLSYDHLPSKLKQCFTYCGMYPKDYRYKKIELIGHWIAQGFINIDDGESSFMHLLRMGFFQEAEEDDFDEIRTCKMHDIMHDLAMHLGGEESIMMTSTSLNMSTFTRHVNLLVGGEEGELKDIPPSLLKVKSIRTCMLSGLSPNLGHLFSNFKLLRTLTLAGLGIEHIPSSIEELKLLRYLDLSRNEFEKLPNSMTNLVNLLVLDINSCEKFKVWPRNFKKLINLWSLFLEDCGELMLMPEGIGGMARLQYLTDFHVGKKSELDVLNGLLKKLSYHLSIKFCEEMEVEDELNWQLPADVSLKTLSILSYPGQRIRGWENSNCTSRVECLVLQDCKNVKYLPYLRGLPILKKLELERLSELEFVEEEEMINDLLFFPCLEVLTLKYLPKLEGWCRKVAEEARPSSTPSASSFLEFPHVSKLQIRICPNLKSFPRCPNLEEFTLQCVMRDSPPEILSTSLFSNAYPSLQRLYIYGFHGLKKLHLESPRLQSLEIYGCDELKSIELVGAPEPSLQRLLIKYCEQLESLHIEAHLIASLEEMIIRDSPDLRLRLSETQGKRVPTCMGCELHLSGVDGELAKPMLSWLMSSLWHISIEECNGPMSLVGVAFTSLRECVISETHGMESLHIPSPHLQSLFLDSCRGLTSAEFEAPTAINISECPELKSLRTVHLKDIRSFIIKCSMSKMVAGVDWDYIPNLSECSCISSIWLEGVDVVFMERLLSSPSSSSSSSSSLTIPFKSLETFYIMDVDGLKILNIESPLLKHLIIARCSHLTNVRIVNPTALTDLSVTDCPEFRMTTGMNWDALTNLNRLELHPLRPQEELPECLLQRQALGHLQIKKE